MKKIIVILTSFLVLICGYSLYQNLLIKDIEKTIVDREKTIIAYKMAIEAIAKSSEINLELLKGELENNFFVSEQFFDTSNKEYFLILDLPNEPNSRFHEIWNHYGLSLVLDINMKFKTIGLYKP